MNSKPMSTKFLGMLAILAVSLATPSMAAEVGVSVSVGQPGFYGRIDIGSFPAPRNVYDPLLNATVTSPPCPAP